MNNRQRIILIFPPAFSTDQPYLAIPSLAAFLKANKIDNVRQWDCNIDAFWYFLQRDILQQSLQHIRCRREFLESQSKTLSEIERQEYHQLCKADLGSDIVLKRLEYAKAYFRQNRSTSIEEYWLHIRTISKALAIISAAYYPSKISLHDFRMRFSCQRSQDIFKAASSPENPYMKYLEQKVLPRLLETKPKLVGVSIACMSQIIPSFTLAKMIRESLPSTKIVFGGQVFNKLITNIMKIRQIFELVDYFVVREGETALLQLTRYLDGEIGIDDVPNLVYLDSDKHPPVEGEKIHVEDINLLPPPDFSGLDLSQYLAPAPVLPYQPTRGCYWHRCAFCNHFAIHPAKERAKSPNKFVSELQQLKETYRTPYFTFVNESIRPQLLHEYADAINRSKLNLEWYVGARFEQGMDTKTLSALKSSGCIKIYFGLESGSQRVLDSMRKGISLTNARRILKDCKKFDIAVHLFLMLGFPTEKLEDIRASEKIVYELASLVPRKTFTYYISIYQLKPCSFIFDNPEKFDIVSIHRASSETDMEYLYKFEVANRGGPIDYQTEVSRLESILDEIKGQPVYPENIIHFLTMRTMFANTSHLVCQSSYKALPQPEKGVFKIREDIAFTKIKSYNGGREFDTDWHLVYDYWSNEIFEINNPVVWNVMERMSGPFDTKALYNVIKIELSRKNQAGAMADSMVEGLLESHLVVPVNDETEGYKV